MSDENVHGRMIDEAGLGRVANALLAVASAFPGVPHVAYVNPDWSFSVYAEHVAPPPGPEQLTLRVTPRAKDPDHGPQPA